MSLAAELVSQGSTLDLGPSNFTVEAVPGVKVSRVLFLVEEGRHLSMRGRSHLYVQIDASFRGRHVEYNSPVDDYDLKRLLTQRGLFIATRFGAGSRAKPRSISIRFTSTDLFVWLDEMLQRGLIQGG